MMSSTSYCRFLTILEWFTLFATIGVSSAQSMPSAFPVGYAPQGHHPIGYGVSSAQELPPGAKAVPNKYARKLARKKTRSIMGVPANPNALPTVACPKHFAYQFEKKRGGWYGYVALPKSPNVVEYTVEINMTINRNVLNSDVIKLNLMSTDKEAHTERYLKWAVKFPYQDLLPKLTQIMFNYQVICRDDPEPIPRGGTQVKMWAKSHVTTGEEGGEPINRGNALGAPTPDSNKPKLGSVLGGLLEAIDKLTATSFTGGIQGGYNTNLGSLYSTGQIGIGAETYGSLANGFETKIKSVFDGQTGIGDFGLYGRGTANFGGKISSSGLGWGGNFQGFLAPAG